MYDHTWRKVPRGPSGLFRCQVCHILKWRDASTGRWHYYADQETRKRKTKHSAHRPRGIRQVNITLMSPAGWVHETYQWPPGYGRKTTKIMWPE